MAIAAQQPGVLNLVFSRGEAWSQLVDFSQPASVSGYTFSAGLYSTITGEVAQPITVSVVDASAGQVNMSLTAAQTAALRPGTYEFRLSWGPVDRRVYQGYCEVLP